MKTPNDFQLTHMYQRIYDPIKAHEYYMRTRHLKGRRKGQTPPPANPKQGAKPQALKPKLPQAQRTKGILSPREQQKIELKRHINVLENKLNQLEVLIQRKEAVLKRDQLLAKQRANQNQTGKAKGPKTAAQKAKAARQTKLYQQAHKQQLKSKAQAKKAAGGGTGGSKTKSAGNQPKPDSKKSIAELKALATKVRGLIAVAKTKLAAL